MHSEELRRRRAEAELAWAAASQAEADRLLAIRDPAARVCAYMELTVRLAIGGDALLPADDERVCLSFGRGDVADLFPAAAIANRSPLSAPEPATLLLATVAPETGQAFRRTGSPAGAAPQVGAAQELITSEPPLRVPGRTAAGRRRFPTLVRSAGRPAPRALPGLRGLALFWGVVGLAFGGGVLVLQSLGPPEGSHAVARAGGTGPAEPPALLPASEAWVDLPPQK